MENETSGNLIPLLGNKVQKPMEEEKSSSEMKKALKKTPMGGSIKLLQQMAINTAYAATSLSIGVRGATLLDLTQIYSSDVETLSMNLVFYSVTKAIGCLVCGEVLHRVPHLGYLWFFLNLLILATSTALTPFLPSVEAFFMAAAALGFAVGCMHTSAGVLSLALWEEGSGTHMHILMAFFSTGGFLAPLLAKPFLSNEHSNLSGEEQETQTAITLLYPLVAFLVLLASVAPFAFGLHDLFVSLKSKVHLVKEASKPITKDKQSPRSERGRREMDKQEGHEVTFQRDPFKGRKSLMVCLALAFCIVVTAYDFGTSSFLATFAVTTDMVELSKEDGADLLAVFMGASAAFRMVCILLSLKLSPDKMAVFLCSIIMTANVLLVSTTAIWSKPWLMICFALQAAISPLYGNNWVWLNQYVKVDGRTGSFITAIASVGNILSPILIGQMVNSVPMVFIYFELASGCLCCTFYLIGSLVGRPILQSKKFSLPI